MRALWYAADTDGQNEVNIEEFRRFLRKCEKHAQFEDPNEHRHLLA